MKLFILIFMLFCHIVDDYYLQGLLAQLKQKSWWKENYPNKMYQYDYLIALIEHSFSWAFMIMLPIFVVMYKTDNYRPLFYCLAILLNMVVHSIIDHLKANCKKFGLLVDQLLHIIQIVITWLVYIIT